MSWAGAWAGHLARPREGGVQVSPELEHGKEDAGRGEGSPQQAGQRPRWVRAPGGRGQRPGHGRRVLGLLTDLPAGGGVRTGRRREPVPSKWANCEKLDSGHLLGKSSILCGLGLVAIGRTSVCHMGFALSEAGAARQQPRERAGRSSLPGRRLGGLVAAEGRGGTPCP